MDILKTLSSDHRELKSLLNRIELTTERGVKTREKLFKQFKTLLDSHAKAEEAVLYENLKREGDAARDIALEAFEEHHVAKILLRELSLLPKDSERWLPKLKVLKEALSHHIHEEEDELFTQARKAFDRGELQAMNDDFIMLKKAQAAGVGLPLRIASKAIRRLAG